MGTTRSVYNRSLYHIKQSEKTVIDKKHLQSLFVTRKSRDGVINPNIQDWELETPKDIRNGAIRDLKKAFTSAFSNLRNGNIQTFKMGYKRKKTYPSVEIPRSAIKLENGFCMIYPKYKLGKIKMSKRDKQVALEYDCRLAFQNDEWYLVVPFKKLVSTKKPENGIMSLDPGVRTFQTGYSEKEATKIQHNRELLITYRQQLDKFRSLRDRKLISRSSFTRRTKRIYRKARHYIDELHYRTIQYLRSYQYVLLPSFESQEMVQGTLRRKTKRELLGLQHFQFKQRLRNSFQLERYNDVEIVSEEYTSKTCGRCGIITSIGSSVQFNCNRCNLHLHRDVNGARNILLKRLYGN